jgi:hypothetical protein
LNHVALVRVEHPILDTLGFGAAHLMEGEWQVQNVMWLRRQLSKILRDMIEGGSIDSDMAGEAMSQAQQMSIAEDIDAVAIAISRFEGELSEGCTINFQLYQGFDAPPVPYGLLVLDDPAYIPVADLMDAVNACVAYVVLETLTAPDAIVLLRQVVEAGIPNDKGARREAWEALDESVRGPYEEMWRSLQMAHVMVVQVDIKVKSVPMPDAGIQLEDGTTIALRFSTVDSMDNLAVWAHIEQLDGDGRIMWNSFDVGSAGEIDEILVTQVWEDGELVTVSEHLLETWERFGQQFVIEEAPPMDGRLCVLAPPTTTYSGTTKKLDESE